MPGAKNFCFTLFDFTLKDKFIEYGCKYLIMGLEICPESKREHYQSYMEFKSTKEFAVLRKHFPKVHFERRIGTQEEAIKYCKKGEQSKEEWTAHKWHGPNWGLNAKVEEYGEFTEDEQGKRNDLITIKDKLLEGIVSCEDIMEEMPNMYHQYGRTLDKIEDKAMRKKFRNFMTLGFWLWGDTGAGKSHLAFKDFSPDTHYILNLNDKGWWEGYKQQDTVIMNEFRGQITYGELLDLVDKWPKSVPRRGREPLPFISKRIIITSSLPPDEVYHNLSINDSLEQLKRRFKIIQVRSGQEVILDS